MNNNIIEKYITFWIDNGYLWLYPKYEIDTQWWIKLYDEEFIDLYHSQTHLFVLITSKEFIEAISRGLWEIKNPNLKLGIYANQTLDQLTYEQAIAIRDGTLEEFINTII